MEAARYAVEIPDYAYWKRQIKCQEACPVRTDARGYIQAVRRGAFEAGYLSARAPNPLASICGKICGAPCEKACRRGDIDKPVAIRALKRFLADGFGAETYRGSAATFFQSIVKRTEDLDCTASESLPALREIIAARPLVGKRVAVIGSGPAGLAAAHDLALMGAEVTVFEAEEEPGGMLAVGVPEYRLPRKTIRAEVEVIRSLGVRMAPRTWVGRDVKFDQLRAASDAVLIAVGAKRSRALPIPGSSARGVWGGVDFLRAAALRRAPFLGQKVVVVGGGNVAYDVARTVLRQIEADISRTAMRQPFVKEVHLCCLESLEEMPADDVEILEGEEEGIRRHNGLGPKEIIVKDGKAAGVVFKKCLSVFDENKRFAPAFDEDVLTAFEADSVIISVGQAMDLSFLENGSDVRLTPRGLIEMDNGTLMTTAPGVFVAGDVAHGARLLIDAEASGKRAARAIFGFLTGKPLRLETRERHRALPGWKREKDYEKISRVPVPCAPPEARVQNASAPVELGYDEASARRESRRCLDCGVNTIFDGEKCILCGGCADVCPERCLKLVPAGALLENKDVRTLFQHRFEDHPLEETSAIIKDEEKCIRCGLCAERCPVGAITMERFAFEEVWHAEAV